MRLRITQLPDGQYLATSEDIPGLVAQGRTKNEAVTIARRWRGNWTKPISHHLCTDPSHPALVQFPGDQTLYQQVREKIESLNSSSISDVEPTRMVLDEAKRLLGQPSDSSEEGYRVQGIRRRVTEEWGSVLFRLENLAYLATWFINGRFHNGDDPLRFVLSLLAIEATRTIFATVNQLRGALAAETFGYWRTLYETYVYSQLLLQFSEEDPNLPGRLSRSTISMYRDFYEKFGPSGDEQEADHYWDMTERFYTRYPIEGKGDYGWAYPSISRKRPTFRHLAETVDKGSKSLEIYYEFATSKTHGRFIFGFAGIRPTRAVVIGGDSFSSGGIDSVLEFTIPLFRTVVENAFAKSSTTEHGHVLDVMRMSIDDILNDICSIRSANPDMYD